VEVGSAAVRSDRARLDAGRSRRPEDIVLEKADGAWWMTTPARGVEKDRGSGARAPALTRPDRSAGFVDAGASRG